MSGPDRGARGCEPVTLGVAGLGLIGGSVVLRAAELGWRVAGYDPDPRAATALGSALAVRADSLAELAVRAETLVLAGPLDAIVAGLGELSALVPRAALIVDVGSVKAAIARAGAALPAFVPTHPMAGSERGGASAAEAGMFLDRTWAYDPQAARAEAARRFIVAMGARPAPVPSALHDRLVALTSHLPQLVSVALGATLAGRLGEPSLAQLCGPGLGSMLRLAESPWPLWRQILGANADAVAQEVRALAAILSEAADALETGQSDRLAESFDAAASAVAALRANATAPERVDDAGTK